MATTHKILGALLGIGLAASIGGNALADAPHGRKHDAARHHPRPAVEHAREHKPDARHHPRHKESIDAREHHQKDRIGQGVRSGQLTKEEAKTLADEQRAIRKEEQQYRSDGKFTKEERKDIQQDLNAASKNIYQEKHDSETRK